MNTIIKTAAALIATALFATASTAVFAREGTPVGHGIKCFQSVTTNAAGQVVPVQICRKGV